MTGTAWTSDDQSKLRRLFLSVLAKAFRGGFVPQDPNDEPASTLLGRILVKRSTEEKANSKKSRRTTAG